MFYYFIFFFDVDIWSICFVVIFVENECIKEKLVIRNNIGGVVFFEFNFFVKFND